MCAGGFPGPFWYFVALNVISNTRLIFFFFLKGKLAVVTKVHRGFDNDLLPIRLQALICDLWWLHQNIISFLRWTIWYLALGDGSIGKGAGIQAERPSLIPRTYMVDRENTFRQGCHLWCVHPPTLNEWKPHPLWEAFIPSRSSHRLLPETPARSGVFQSKLLRVAPLW